MSDYGTCRICQNFTMNLATHRCPPVWQCIEYGSHIMYESDVTEVHAHDPRDAAQIFVERGDCEGGDYTCLKGHSPQVLVVNQTEFHLFRVSGESVPTYTANAMEEDDDE